MGDLLLDGALDWARRGFRVFRLVPVGKIPLAEGWQREATNDPVRIAELWRQSPDANIGLAMGQGVHAADLDIKNGANGLETFLNLNLFFDTLTNRTPSGGWHVIYASEDDFANNVRLLPGVDIRSAGGYIVAPPSVTPEGCYSIEMDQPLAPLPSVLHALLKPPASAQSNEVLAGTDSPLSIQRVTEIAKTYPVSIQGQGGNNNLFALAALACRDYALAPHTANIILWDNFNPRCAPPWQDGEYGEFERTVHNGAAYGRNAVGERSPERMLESLHVPAEPEPRECPELGRFGNLVPPELRPPTDWVIENFAARGAITTLAGPGGVGKSTLGASFSLAVAQGALFVPAWKAPAASKALLIDKEDTRAFISEKVEAAFLESGSSRDFREVCGNINILGLGDFPFRLTEGCGAKMNKALTDILDPIIERTGLSLLTIAPFVKFHDANEQDNPQMAAVMEALAAWAHEKRVAVILIHHTSKLNALAEMRHGDPDICRGASAIVDGSRAVFTFLPLDKKEGESLGISDQERRLFSRLELAKTNLGPNDIAPVYFKRKSFMSARGLIPVLTPHSWEDQRDSDASRLAELLWVMMAEKATTRITKTELAARWKETDGIRGQQNDKTVAEAISKICFAAGGKLSFERDGRIYTYAREMEGRTTIFVSADLH